MERPDLIGLHIVDPQLVVRLVVSQHHLIVLEIDGFAPDVIAEELVDGCLGAQIPEVHCLIPPSSSQHVVIVGLPLDAEDSIVVVAQVPSLELLRLPLVEQAAVDLAQLAREGIMGSLGTYLACLQHLVVLLGYRYTFLEKRSCLEVACQYSNDPSEWVARKACRSSLLGFMANPVTGERSWLLRTYCVFSVWERCYFGWMTQP